MRSRLSALLGMTCLLATGCWSSRSGETRGLVPELVMEGVRFSLERGGTNRARGEADRVTYRRDTTAFTAEGLSLVLEAADGPVRITAPRGEGVGAERRFDVTGGLTATRGADVALTERARYQGAAGGGATVSGDQPVTVSGPGYRLAGRGFTLDPASGQLVLTGGARLVAGLPVKP